MKTKVWIMVAGMLAVSGGLAGAKDEPSIEAKLQQIVLPKVSLNDATLREAVAFLDGEVEGKEEIEFHIAPGLKSSSKISCELGAVPAQVALKFITELAGVSYRFEPEKKRVLIVGADTPDTGKGAITTRVFDVSDDFLTHAKRTLKCKGNTVDVVLKAAGVKFPDGARATYDKKRNKLLIRNTPANLKPVAALVKKVADLQAKQK